MPESPTMLQLAPLALLALGVVVTLVKEPEDEQDRSLRALVLIACSPGILMAVIWFLLACTPVGWLTQRILWLP